MFEGIRSWWAKRSSATQLLRRLERLGFESDWEHKKCAKCFSNFYEIYQREQTPGRVLEEEFRVLGAFCFCCGISIDEKDDRNLFDLLRKMEEERDPEFATEGRLADATREVEESEAYFARAEKRLEAARKKLLELQSKPRLKESEDYRQLPPGPGRKMKLV